MNKNGLLLAEETLKIIISILAIGLLIYLLTSIYFSYNSSKEFEQAKESLSFISNEANAGKTSVDIYGPKDWWIFSATNQLCICKQNTYSSCIGQEGICQDSEFTTQNSFQINSPPITLSIDKQNRIIGK